jgi:hypothetical protein
LPGRVYAVRYAGPRWLARRLAHVDSPYAFCRRAVACSPDLPADAVQRLAVDDDYSVRLLLAEHHDGAPAELLVDLIPSVGHSLWDLVKHPNLPGEALAGFAVAGDDTIRVAAATSPNLPAPIAVRLAGHEDVRTRRAVAANPALPVPEILRLLRDPDLDTVTAAASNPRLPAADVRYLLEIARRPFG